MKNIKNLERESLQLILRRYQRKDYEIWQKKQEEYYKYEKEKILSKQDFFRELAERKRLEIEGIAFTFACFCKRTGDLFATVNLFNVVRDNYQSCGLGIQSYTKDQVFRFNRDAILLASEVAFEDLALHRIESTVTEENWKGKNFLKASGYRSEGIRKSSIRIDDKWQDTEVFALTKEEWKEKKLSILLSQDLELSRFFAPIDAKELLEPRKRKIS